MRAGALRAASVVAALAAVAAVMLWLILGWPPEPGQGGAAVQGEDATTEQAVPASAAAPAEPAASREVVGVPPRADQTPSGTAPATGRRARSPALAALAASMAARDHWDLCGVGRMPVAPGSPESLEPPDPLGRHAADLWRPRWLAALRAGNARQRAAAELLAAKSDPQPGAAQRATDHLIRLAGESDDPVLMAWAAGRCQATHRQDCTDWPADAWRQRESDNMAAWIDWAERSGAQGEAELAGLAQATRVATYPGTLESTLMNALPPDMPRYLHFLLHLEAMGVVTDLAPPLTRLMSLCHRGKLEMPGRRQSCDRLARLMLDQGDNWHSVNVAGYIGGFLGWPQATVESIKGVAMSGLLEPLDALLVVQPFTCSNVDSLESRRRHVETHGELPTPRPWLPPPAPRTGR